MQALSKGEHLPEGIEKHCVAVSALHLHHVVRVELCCHQVYTLALNRRLAIGPSLEGTLKTPLNHAVGSGLKVVPILRDSRRLAHTVLLFIVGHALSCFYMVLALLTVALVIFGLGVFGLGFALLDTEPGVVTAMRHGQDLVPVERACFKVPEVVHLDLALELPESREALFGKLLQQVHLNCS